MRTESDADLLHDMNEDAPDPPPAGEGAALIAATERETEAIWRDNVGTAAFTLRQRVTDAWAEAARTLARALDGGPDHGRLLHEVSASAIWVERDGMRVSVSAASGAAPLADLLDQLRALR